ncbi:MAG TPA: DUF6687 family protein [Acidimicrobiia bacterium]
MASPLPFVRFDDLDEIPNVVVDGAAGAGTCLVLSHWPGSRTPEAVQDDLSAQIALRALDHPDLFAGVEAVSNNHFDQDGLMSVYALVDPDGARARRERVIDVARAGDFGWYEDRAAARLAMAIAVMTDPDVSPLDPEVFADGDVTGALYDACLPRVTEMLDDTDATRELWEEEDEHLASSEAAIRDGTVSISEHPHVDLAVVLVPDDWATRSAHRFTVEWSGAVHPMAINGATTCLRVMTLHGRRARLECRYETWVQYVSRQVLPRPDLRDLAAALDDAEDGERWRADAPGALTPVLSLRDGLESGLSPHRLVGEIVTWLEGAPGAWDPWTRPR